MANFFDDLMGTLTGKKKQEQGAEQAPSFLSRASQTVTDAWTGFLNKMQESNKQNIQSGHYTVAQPQQPAQSGADLSMQPGTMTFQDLAQGAADKLTGMVTEWLTGKKTEEKKPWESTAPFGTQRYNDMYQDALIALDEANPEQRTRDPREAAYRLVDEYMDDVIGADALNPSMDRSRKNPLQIAQAEWEKKLESLKGEFAAIGKGGSDLEALLNADEFVSEKQHGENQKQAVIDAAAER